MFYDIRVTPRQATALTEWTETTCEQPADVELAAVEGHLLANQGDDYCAWTAAGLAVDDAELDRLLELGRQSRPVAVAADVEAVERMRRELARYEVEAQVGTSSFVIRDRHDGTLVMDGIIPLMRHTRDLAQVEADAFNARGVAAR